MEFFEQIEGKPVFQFKRVWIFVAIWVPIWFTIRCLFNWIAGKQIDVAHELGFSVLIACGMVFVNSFDLVGTKKRMALDQRRANAKRELEAALNDGQLKAAKKNHGVV